jgi:hypothetical protein
MVKRSRYDYAKTAQQGRRGRPSAPAPTEAPKIYQKPIPVTYGKASILLEDAQKNTFEYSRGTWKPFARTIAECRLDCLVKELPQQVNGMTRYEIRFPMAAEE